MHIRAVLATDMPFEASESPTPSVTILQSLRPSTWAQARRAQRSLAGPERRLATRSSGEGRMTSRAISA